MRSAVQIAEQVPVLPRSDEEYQAEKSNGAECCFLCNSKLSPVVIDLHDTRFGIADRYDVYRCDNCSLEQTLPRPSLEELKRLYETYYNFGGRVGQVYSYSREKFLCSAFYRIWMRIDGDISFYLRRGAGRLLDVGCNEGRGLKLYSRNGFSVEGLELNEKAAECARGLGFSVHTCLLGELEREGTYNVAILSNVLEHVPDPLRMMRDVHRILAPGGQVWISCPNSESWLRRVFGRSWVNWHVPFHLFHFSQPTLQMTLDRAGFEVKEVRQITPALWVSHSIICSIFSRYGTANRQLRNPALIAMLLLGCRFLLFPALWLGNRLSKGDCLLAIATKV